MSKDIIDLATLASLGQHFATVQDSTELRGNFASLENDVAIIKQFLSQKYGSEFSRLFRGGKDSLPCAKEPKTTPKTVAITDSIPVNKKIKAPHHVKNDFGKTAGPAPPTAKKTVIISNGQVRPKPPPLQRVTNSNGNFSLAQVKTEPLSCSSSGGEETSKKFQCNFLSNSRSRTTLKSSSGNAVVGAGIASIKRESSTSVTNGIRGNPEIRFGDQITLSKIPSILSQRSGNGGIKSAGGQGSFSIGSTTVSRRSSENYYELQAEEDSYEAGYAGGDENYEAGDEGADAETLNFIPEGDESVDVETGAAYFNSAVQMEFQDDEEEINDEDNYADEMEIVDVNGSVRYATNSNSSETATRAAGYSKRADQRRVTLPTVGSEECGNFMKKCKVCHEDVPSFTLFNHVISTHYSGEIPTCNICNKTFTYKQGLISHMRYHDSQKYDKECSYCGKKFIRRSDVVIHERRLHTGERPYQCPVPDCRQGFVRRYCLLTHVKTNHGEPYMSQIMADATRRKSS